MKRIDFSDENLIKKCDICHKNKNELKDDWADFKVQWGYNSNKDQQHHEIIICSFCYDKIEKYINKIGGKIRKYEYDICSGSIVGEYKPKNIKVKNAQHKNK